jgi:hypothetical protein
MPCICTPRWRSRGSRGRKRVQYHVARRVPDLHHATPSPNPTLPDSPRSPGLARRRTPEYVVSGLHRHAIDRFPRHARHVRRSHEICDLQEWMIRRRRLGIESRLPPAPMMLGTSNRFLLVARRGPPTEERIALRVRVLQAEPMDKSKSPRSASLHRSQPTCCVRLRRARELQRVPSLGHVPTGEPDYHGSPGRRSGFYALASRSWRCRYILGVETWMGNS